MRICHVIESGVAGALEMVLLAAEAQRIQGHRVLIIYCRRPGAPADLRTRTHPEIGLLQLRMRPFIPHLPVWLLRCARKLRRWNPEVLLLHGSFGGFFGRLAAGPRFGGGVLFCTHCVSLMHLDFSAYHRAMFRILERLAQFVCPAVYVACTRPELEVITREIGAPVRLLENAVDDFVRDFRQGKQSRAQLRRVVTCARIAPQKDPETFAAICRAVRSVRPEVEFEWIGDGDATARRTLLRAGVIVTGWLSRKDVFRHMADACVYVSTSIFEGMPVSVLEAMFLEIPVLCRNAEWSAAIICDRTTGFLFDDVRTATAILLSVDASTRTDMAKAAYMAASERFSQDRFAANLELLCQEARTRSSV